MTAAFVFDEHLRGIYLAAVDQHNDRGHWLIDATEVGEPDDLPAGTPDPELLIWAEANGRLVVSRDYGTMAGHLADHLAAGRRSPGVLLVRPGTTLRVLVEFLALATYAGDPADYADRVTFIP